MLAAVVGKFAGGYAGARLSGLGVPMVVGRVLVPRGEFSLVLAKAGVDAAVVPTEIYPVAGFAVLVTAIIAPLLGRMKVSVQLVNRKKQA